MTVLDPLADVFPDTLHAPLPVLTNAWGVRDGAKPHLEPHPADDRWAPQPQKGTG